MWTKPYGKTGKNVSVIAFGGMRFSKPQDIDGMAQLVLYAHSKGINYFDTAPFYCDDKSEDIMGAAFKAMPRNSFFCSTKCGSASGDEMRKSIERSLKRLNVDYIDFFHVWCLVWPHQLKERIDQGAIPVLMKAKEEGLVRHVVVSTHLPGAEIAKVLDSGYFEGLTIGYNALNFPFRQDALTAALKHNAGVVTMNPLGGGLIPRNAERLAFLRGPEDRDVVQAALRFNISQPAITAALVGFSSTEEVDQAVQAVSSFKPYAPDHIEKLKSQIATSFDGFCTGCGYCLPCPSNVEIPRFMDAYNQKILEGNDQAIKNRLQWHWNLTPQQASECAECGACEDTCTQHLPIRERLKHIASLAEAKK
jgi:predicted aldo/keto reductase-like oxidoreductase